MVLNNWVSEENNSEWHKKAKQLASEHQKKERQLLKTKKKVLIPHPTSPRCFIEKFE